MLSAVAGIVLIAACLTTGLTAGLLLVFAHAVMPGLATLDDHGLLTAFRRIDAAIVNPWLGLTFGGSPVLILLATVLYGVAAPPVLVWIVPALGLTLATVIITRAVHLPLNAAVAAAAPSFDHAADLRRRFERRWVRWNVVRTATATVATALLAAGLLVA